MVTAESYIGSNDFWNMAISVGFGVLIGVGGAWATLRSNNPKRRVVWNQSSNTTLLRSTSPSAPSAVSVSHAGTTLVEPRLVELEFSNSGRRDISPTDFASGDESLIFDFGANIVTVLDTEVDPPSAPKPQHVIDGPLLKVKKVLVARNQRVTFSVLVDGPKGNIKLAAAHLTNTPVKRGVAGATRFLGGLVLTMAVLVTLATFLVSRVMSAPGEAADLKMDKRLLESCRYWDQHDKEKADKMCPPIRKP
ncbi:hypothetical protein [Streptomyces regalis]|uniref:hypothetical protein n=1 Tax=Streptomyces regalis TaxID=68262 RepID=UPI00131B0721|nr:hypothetical protein [Streptomyces regalis]